MTLANRAAHGDAALLAPDEQRTTARSSSATAAARRPTWPTPAATRSRNDPFLHLFDLAARQRARRVAHHDSSWGVYKGNRQVTHPHPSFTPDERQVLFSADGDGEPGLYLVDIPPAAA